MLIAAPRLSNTPGVSPDLASSKPPFKPSAISRYSDRNLAIDLGISRLDPTAPASTSSSLGSGTKRAHQSAVISLGATPQRRVL